MVNLNEIPRVILSSDMPDKFTGVVKKVEEQRTKEGGRSLEITILVKSPASIKNKEGNTVQALDRNTMVMYRLPKALTGRGQGDMLLKFMHDIGYEDTDDLIDKEFVWERHTLADLGSTLPAGFNPNPRHYPVKLSKPIGKTG